MRWHRDERGTMTAGFILLFGGLLGSGVLLLLVGRGAVLRAEAVTAADAAALAAAEDLRDQLVELVERTGFEEPTQLDYGAARVAAQEYARRNGAELVDFRARGLEVVVETATQETVGRGELVDLGGRDVPDVEAGDVRGTARARAIVEMSASGGTEGRPAPGAPALEPSALTAAARGAGVRAVPPSSALRRYNGDGYSSTPSVSGLAPEMREEILKVEVAMGRGLELTSAYRSPQGQARVCAQVRSRNPNALCAPPGHSLHQAGLAIDTPDPGFVLEALRRDPSIALCQPFPRNDAVHFSHSSRREAHPVLGEGLRPAGPAPGAAATAPAALAAGGVREVDGGVGGDRRAQLDAGVAAQPFAEYRVRLAALDDVTAGS